jgi:hypothetical protein
MMCDEACMQPEEVNVKDEDGDEDMKVGSSQVKEEPGDPVQERKLRPKVMSECKWRHEMHITSSHCVCHV